ncbi:MAG: ABC transporter ATP-binding protein [Acutalibacteraceae bacterium]
MIEIIDLCKNYYIGKGKKASTFNALNKVNLKINDGESVAIQGKSGAGKSTLLNILGLLDSYDSGSFTIDGKQVNTLTDKDAAEIRNKKIGFVLQDFSLIDSKSVAMNVMLPLFFSDCKYDEMYSKAEKALALVGIADQIKKKTTQLSGGQRQRVAIARAIITEPSIILADEPTGSLDSETSVQIMELLSDLNKKQNITLIVVTHDNTVAEFCQRKIIISDGQIKSDI